MPFCAAFVRHLDVKLVETKQFSIQGRPGITRSNLDIHPISLNNLKRQAKSSYYAYLSSCLSQEPIATFERTMSLLVDVMPSLDQVRLLSIDCWDLDPNFNLQPILTTAWSSFGPNLTTLVFKTNLDGFPHLTASSPVVPNLTTLELEITVNLYNRSREFKKELDSLENHIAPFISSLSLHLESFTFFLWSDLDLSIFFNRFPDRFDRLKHVSLRMPYNKPYKDPGGLLKFLSPVTSPVLRELQVRLNPTGAALDRTTEFSLVQFLTTLSDDHPTSFTSLHALDIFPTHLPEGLTVLHTSILRSTETLRNVSIRDRSLQFEELKAIVTVLGQCECLEMLRFNLSRLDVDVVDLLAFGLPGLKRLSILIDESRNIVEPSISPTLDEDLAMRDYRSWKLRDIGLWRAGSRVDTRLLQAFARHVPSINSFWGDGHVDQDRLIQVQQRRREEAGAVSTNARWLWGCLSAIGLTN
ncbi:hypothetical protein P691DRAFT_804653 [Macrolepiota fuliginosa MF-IS2]|uniref:Uncharacterized protein n=1 Tax=Macrolepiota fuliginosa MF-IS2 TaxID=1400762 RepID=A0A9P5XBA6_9AGAR|nr:hypothetical protein P691DRAFT_804653 [Macrolepiota fuliginosa MF-IS2]